MQILYRQREDPLEFLKVQLYRVIEESECQGFYLGLCLNYELLTNKGFTYLYEEVDQ